MINCISICMVWFHTACVGIVDIDEVGAWTCVVCRKLPENVTEMKSQINSLLENTNTILKLFKSFTQKVDDKFENLNDRLTAIANQNKCYNESSTSSMSDIRQNLTSLQNDVETKSGAILSRSQCILDKVRTTSDLVSKLHDGKSINTKNTNSSDHCVRNDNQVATVEATNCHKTHSSNETVITIDDDDNDKNRHTKANPQTPSQLSDHSDSAKKDDNTFLSPKQPIKKFTFIVGSCILQSIETRFLAENVRVKSFKNASISALEQKLSTMDLSCYDKKVQVGKDQEKAQSEKDSHSKNRGGKKPNQQSGTYTMKHIVSRMSSYFPNRWPLSYLNLTKNMKTYIRRQQHKIFFQTPRHKTKRTTTEVSTWNDQ